ncbi:MAG TPA: hypothetical protein VLW75_01085 [Rhizomicrobium sp.]|nr:hypothetical protein [Rhizomicrobium sp.]
MSDVTPGPADNYKASASYRGARAAVILLGVLLLIAFALLIVGFAVKLTGRGGSPATGGPVLFTLAPGAKIVSSQLGDNRLVLHVRSAAGDEIDIIDTQNGRLVGQIKPQDAGKAK